MADVLQVVTSLRRKHARFIVGGTFMIAGSSLAVFAGHWHELPMFARVGVDVIAYAIHGSGAVPFVAPLIRHFNLD